MESIEVDVLMNSKGEWGHNHLPRGNYREDNTPEQLGGDNLGNRDTERPGNQRQGPGNRNPGRPELSNYEDSNTSNKQTAGNKRQIDSEFQDSFSQRRLRRRLDLATVSRQQVVTDSNPTPQVSLGQQDGQQKPVVANPARPGYATAQKWQQRARNCKAGGNRVVRVGNKEQHAGNTKKQVLDDQKSTNLKQKSLDSWLKHRT